MTETVMSFHCTWTYLQRGSLICFMFSQYLPPRAVFMCYFTCSRTVYNWNKLCWGFWGVLIVSEQFHFPSADFLHFWQTDHLEKYSIEEHVAEWPIMLNTEKVIQWTGSPYQQERVPKLVLVLWKWMSLLVQTIAPHFYTVFTHPCVSKGREHKH